MYKDIDVVTLEPLNRKIYTEKEVDIIKTKYLKHLFFNVLEIIIIAILIIMVIEQYMTIQEKEKTISSLESQVNALEYDSSIHKDTILDLNMSLEDTTTVINSLYTELETVNKSLENAEAYIESSITAPSSKRYNRNTDLGITEIINADRMNRIIDYWNNKCGGTPFVNKGQAFIKASQETGYDPIFLFAICGQESGFGTSRIARIKGNYCGIGAYDSSPYSSAITMSDNVEDSIILNAVWIYDHYYKQNQNTLDKMIYGKKCYSSSKEDWINGITSIMNISAKIK